MELTSEEGRVLGCLVEKQLTTPQLYPLTESALIAACNQSTNRNPMVVYDVSTVRITARSLREKGLLRMVHRAGERSDKHQHLLDRRVLGDSSSVLWRAKLQRTTIGDRCRGLVLLVLGYRTRLMDLAA
jgi:uncharacterized protein YceH (UPF0502 family)